jgi:hypothetical protein
VQSYTFLLKKTSKFNFFWYLCNTIESFWNCKLLVKNKYDETEYQIFAIAIVLLNMLEDGGSGERPNDQDGVGNVTTYQFA